MTIDEESLFKKAGLVQIHQVQNEMLLCVLCHREFDALKRYSMRQMMKLVINTRSGTEL
jgi:hypothetical protein